MSSSPRDVIQISLGSSSNAVTAHFLNLQGLSVTDEEGACDAPTTHRLEDNHWVPRCLLVDEPTRFFVSPEISQQALRLSQQQQLLEASSTFSSTSISSRFAVQPLDSALHLEHAQPSAWSQRYQSLSSTLAYSSCSRYYQEPAAGTPNAPTYQVSSENDRHVNWDDLGDENEEAQEDDEWQLQARKEQERKKWQQDTLEPIQEQLQTVVNELSAAENNPSSPSSSSAEPSSWMDYWMPPYSEQSKVALEYSHQSHLTPHWDAAYPISLGNSRSNGSSSDWLEDDLYDRLRRLLEESDSCQGFLITTQGHGWYAGLTTALLQEIQQETKSAGRIVFHVTNPHKDESLDKVEDEKDSENQPWQPAHVERVRQHISNGLVMHDFTQNAHVVVPLSLPNIDNQSLFRGSAQVAMALEACMLPIRLKASSSTPRRIGLTNAPFLGQGGDYDAQWGSTAQRLSMSEYIQCLQPSSQYKLLEIDTLSPTMEPDNDKLWQALLPGTSLERDARTRDDGHSTFRPRDAAPGGWMERERLNSGGGPGLLTPLSPQSSTNPRFGDRSLHHHFALSTAVRPVLLRDASDPRYQYDPMAKTLPHYLTAIVQGMGIAYRPERSVATVMNQTVGQLTFGSPTSGGAGAYWRSLLSSVKQPTLAVLGNSTRVYSHVQQISSDMKMVLGPRYRGYHQRDIVNDVLPEAEDCQEALEGCLNLRDVYHPPDASGLAVDDSDGDIDY